MSKYDIPDGVYVVEIETVETEDNEYQQIFTIVEGEFKGVVIK